MIKIDGKLYYTAKDVCERLNVSKKTLFKWEKMGIIPSVDRDWRNWRLYTEENLQHLAHFIEKKRMERIQGEN